MFLTKVQPSETTSKLAVLGGEGRETQHLSQEAFHQRLHMEQKRTERSERPFVLVLMELPPFSAPGFNRGAGKRVISALLESTRATDAKGWYRTGSSLGVIFTEIGLHDPKSVGESLIRKLRDLIETSMDPVAAGRVKLSFCVYPGDWDKTGGQSGSPVLYPGTATAGRRLEQGAKRFLDICGSATALIVGSPLFLAAALGVKLSSKGPVLFRQRRVGQYGREFMFLKFRSMFQNNDTEVHRAYVQQMIEGSAARQDSVTGEMIYKLTKDSRVTTFGKFLRKTSLDELPQFWNVLRGDMSLVGPRPPIQYEVELYDLWHRRRLLEVKPGITGLWQVGGRSQTTFDEMVRLDLQYASTWSLWLDIKILLKTPRAVLSGKGAV